MSLRLFCRVSFRKYRAAQRNPVVKKEKGRKGNVSAKTREGSILVLGRQTQGDVCGFETLGSPELQSETLSPRQTRNVRLVKTHI